MSVYRYMTIADSLEPIEKRRYHTTLVDCLGKQAETYGIIHPALDRLVIRDGLPSDFNLPREHEEWLTPELPPYQWSRYISCTVPPVVMYAFYGVAVEEWPTEINALELIGGYCVLGRWNIQRMNARITRDRPEKNYRFRREAWVPEPFFFRPEESIILNVHTRRTSQPRQHPLALLWLVAEPYGRTVA